MMKGVTRLHILGADLRSALAVSKYRSFTVLDHHPRLHKSTNTLRTPGFKSAEQGFTIIELLIATVVFASVLLLLTMGVLSFTKSYFRGVNQSATQNTARTIIEDITEAVQFSGSAIYSPIAHSTTPTSPSFDFNNPWSQGFCLGNQLYSYVTGWQLTDDTPDISKHQTNHALMRSSPGNCGGLPAQDVRAAGPAGVEMLQPRMRLAKLAVDPTSDPSVWKITVRVVYGDDDLLCSPSVSGDCTSTATSSSLNNGDLTCKTATSGTQFCAASELSTVVKRRITSGP